MNIIDIDPLTSSLWQTLVVQHHSDAFHSRGWIQVLRETYGFKINALVVLDDEGEPRAGLTYCRIDDMMDPRIVSLPFSDFCDPLVNNRAEWNCLIEKLLAEGYRTTLRCLHNEIPLKDSRLALVNQAKWHCISLRPDLDTIYEGLDGSARRAIKKAQRAGVVARVAERKEELRAFFELHLRVRKYKYQLLAQPYRFFENIWEHFIEQDRGALIVAVHEDEVIGGVLFLEWKDRLYYKFNASNPDRIALRPNDLVIWHGIQYGKAKGYSYLDFGLSDWDQEGLLRYKRKYATEEKTISFLRYEPANTPSKEEKQMRSLLPQLTDLFVAESVPDNISEQAGNVLYRFFT